MRSFRTTYLRISNEAIRRIALIFAFALLTHLTIPSPALAWDRTGHRVVATIAESCLTPAASAAVHSLLARDETLAGVSSWADTQRMFPGFWHYVNVPLSESHYDSRFCHPEGCVVGAVEAFKGLLIDRTASRLERQRALKMLIHLIADVHQPLHVGDNRDRGGNNKQVRFFNRGSNLHKVWDTELLDLYSPDVWLAEAKAPITPAMAAEWSKGTSADWATESLQLAAKAYQLPGKDTPMKSGAKIGEDYCNFAVPIIQQRLAQAGVRVAAVLNQIR